MNELDGELARPLGKPRRSWQGRSRVDEAAVGVSVGAWPEPRPAWEDRPLLEKVSAWTKLPARIPARLSPPRPTPPPVWSQYFRPPPSFPNFKYDFGVQVIIATIMSHVPA